jgi:prepilin-type N-terminal cleavage/methylation domain-containing protein
MPKRVDQHIRSRLKGFTLIEVVVSLILLAAVMLCMATGFIACHAVHASRPCANHVIASRA